MQIEIKVTAGSDTEAALANSLNTRVPIEWHGRQLRVVKMVKAIDPETPTVFDLVESDDRWEWEDEKAPHDGGA